MSSIEILDSTLRDGMQGEGIAFSIQDKIKIARTLDELGIRYIEAGNPGSNIKDREFFRQAADIQLKQARLVAFGATRRKDTDILQDPMIACLVEANTPVISIVGKTWICTLLRC